jgi:hypothetical protein
MCSPSSASIYHAWYYGNKNMYDSTILDTVLASSAKQADACGARDNAGSSWKIHGFG